MVIEHSYNLKDYLLFAFIVFCGIIYRSAFFEVPLLNIDESISAIIGVEINHGNLPYKHAVDHRGPLTYYIYALSFALGGDYNMYAARLLQAILFILSSWALLLIGGFLDKKLGHIMVLFFLLLSISGPICDFIAFHTEWPLVFCVLWGIFFLLKYTLNNNASRLYLVVSMLFFSLAILSKQVAGFDLVVAGLIYLILVIYRKKKTVQIIKDIVVMFFTIITVFASVYLYFYINNASEDLIFYVLTYNQKYYLHGRDYSRILKEPIVKIINYIYYRSEIKWIFLVIAPSALIAFLLSEEKRKYIFWLLISGFALYTILLSTCLSGRQFDHYLIQALPYLAFTFSILLYMVLNRFKYFYYLIFAGAIGLIPFYLVSLKSNFDTIKELKERDKEPIVDYINKTKNNQDKLFIWGFNSEPIVYTKLRTATRFTFCNFQTGLLPFTNIDPSINTTSTIVPNSREQLMDDLKKSMPRFIIDSSPSNYNYFGKYPLYSFPDLENFIRNNYFKLNLEPNQEYASVLYQRNY